MIVADASPLIALAIIEHLWLLPRFFDQIFIPQAVFNELIEPNKPHAELLRSFAAPYVTEVQNRTAVELLTNSVDLGESEAIVLALEHDIATILIDDAKGRRVAKANGLSLLGTLGLLIMAKQQGEILQIRPLLDLLVANKIRISAKLFDEALRLADEL